MTITYVSIIDIKFLAYPRKKHFLASWMFRIVGQHIVTLSKSFPGFLSVDMVTSTLFVAIQSVVSDYVARKKNIA